MKLTLDELRKHAHAQARSVSRIVPRDPTVARSDLDAEVTAGPGEGVMVTFTPMNPFRMQGLAVDGPLEVMARWGLSQIWVGLESQIIEGAPVVPLTLVASPGAQPLIMPATRSGVQIHLSLVNLDRKRKRSLRLRLLGEEVLP